MQCAAPYAPLLRAWASAGYVVAAVNFPRTDCRTGTAAYEPDVVNQPADMSYVITRLLALSGRTHGLLAGLLDPREVAVAGHSDGADTVASLAATRAARTAGWRRPGHGRGRMAGDVRAVLHAPGSADAARPGRRRRSTGPLSGGCPGPTPPGRVSTSTFPGPRIAGPRPWFEPMAGTSCVAPGRPR